MAANKDEVKENPAASTAGSRTESSEKQPSKNIISQSGVFSPGNLKRACFHLGDQDRQAIRRICDRLDLPTSALAIRYALRLLDRRLAENPPKTMVEASLLLGGIEANKKP